MKKDIKNLLTVRVEPLAWDCAHDLHMKQEESYSHPENSGGCRYPPEVRRKLSAGTLTNWLN